MVGFKRHSIIYNPNVQEKLILSVKVIKYENGDDDPKEGSISGIFITVKQFACEMLTEIMKRNIGKYVGNSLNLMELAMIDKEDGRMFMNGEYFLIKEIAEICDRKKIDWKRKGFRQVGVDTRFDSIIRGIIKKSGVKSCSIEKFYLDNNISKFECRKDEEDEFEDYIYFA
jgi:hypothetical protein